MVTATPNWPASWTGVFIRNLEAKTNVAFHRSILVFAWVCMAPYGAAHREESTVRTLEYLDTVGAEVRTLYRAPL
jgi:hypothetical protein